MPAYRLPSPYARPPLQRRAAGFALALAVNLGLLLVLMTLGVIPPPGQKAVEPISVDLIPQSHRDQRSEEQSRPMQRQQQQHPNRAPVLKPPPITLPVKPTITPAPVAEKPLPWIEMSRRDMAAGDLGNVPAATGRRSGDSEEVGRGPHGEVLYAAEWARHPTDAELGGYLPRNAPEGWGLIACRTIPGNRVDDCIELGQDPPGSHLASAVRQAAWQFRVRPPRKNGRAMIGEWVRIRIDYQRVGGGQ